MLDIRRPITYLITQGDARTDNFAEARRNVTEVISKAVDAGVDLIQIREKHLTGKLLYDLAVQIRELVYGTRTRLLVNDRLDIALAAGADGVHLAKTSLRPSVVKEHTPRGFIVACSVHSLDEAMNAKSEGADLCVYGPVFETPGKGTPQGVDKLREVCDAVSPMPVLALGGVNAGNLSVVLETGAAGIAAIRALNDVDEMRRIVSAGLGASA